MSNQTSPIVILPSPWFSGRRYVIISSLWPWTWKWDTNWQQKGQRKVQDEYDVLWWHSGGSGFGSFCRQEVKVGLQRNHVSLPIVRQANKVCLTSKILCVLQPSPDDGFFNWIYHGECISHSDGEPRILNMWVRFELFWDWQNHVSPSNICDAVFAISFPSSADSSSNEMNASILSRINACSPQQ